MEIRSYQNEASPKVENRTIEGYAVVFNQRSKVLYDATTKRFFYEEILPGAITEDLLKRSDVKALLEHDKNRLLARSVKGEGSLTLTVDDYGLKYRFEAPDTQDGNYAVEMVKRGDLFGSSFAFFVDQRSVKWEKQPDGMMLRKIPQILSLRDVSIVSDPAYGGTEVNVRSMQDVEESFKVKDEKYLEDINFLKSHIK